MALYRTLEPRAYRLPEFRKLGTDAQYLLVFLATGPLSGRIPGVVVTARSGLAEELGWSLPRLQKALKVAADVGFLRADWTTGLVWAPWALGHARVDSPSSVQGWADAWEELPPCPALAQIHTELGAWLLARPWAKDTAAKVQAAWDAACPCPPCAPSGWVGYPTHPATRGGTPTHPPPATPSTQGIPQAPTPYPTPLDTPTHPTPTPGSRKQEQEAGTGSRREEGATPSPATPPTHQAPDSVRPTAPEGSTTTASAPVSGPSTAGSAPGSSAEPSAAPPPKAPKPSRSGVTSDDLKRLWVEACAKPGADLTPWPEDMPVGKLDLFDGLAGTRPLDGPKGWLEVFAAIGRSDLLNGRKDAGRRADPDFLLDRKGNGNLGKLLAGAYEDRPKSAPKKTGWVDPATQTNRGPGGVRDDF